MDPDTRKVKEAALVAVGGLTFVVLGTIFLFGYLLTLGLLFAGTRAALGWGFSISSQHTPLWVNVTAVVVAVVGTTFGGRLFNRAAILIRRLCSKPTTGRHATTVRQDLGRVAIGGVKWAEFFGYTAIGIPSIVAAVYIVNYTTATWFDVTPFVAKVLVIVVAAAIALPISLAKDRLVAARRDDQGEGSADQSR